MANYDASLTVNLAVGETQILSNASLASPFTTQAIAVGRDAGQPCELVVYNGSSQVATIQVADTDLDASYLAFKVDGTAVTVAATTAQQFRCDAKFMRCSMAADPGTAKVIVGR